MTLPSFLSNTQYRTLFLTPKNLYTNSAEYLAALRLIPSSLPIDSKVGNLTSSLSNCAILTAVSLNGLWHPQTLLRRSYRITVEQYPHTMHWQCSQTLVSIFSARS